MGFIALYNTLAVGYMIAVLFGKIIQIPHAVNKCYSYICSRGLEGMAVDAFFVYTNTLYKAEKLVHRVYTAHPISQELIDRFIYTMYYLHAEFTDYRIEPYHQSWISISTLEKSPHLYVPMQHRTQFFGFKDPMLYAIENTRMNELYCMVYRDNTTVDLLINANYAKNANDLLCDINWKPIINSHITMKYNARYFSKVLQNTDESVQLIDLSAKRSRVSFMSIEYEHPSLSKPIVIELDKMYYTVGNDLLSASFLRRYLEHQCNESYNWFNCLFEPDDNGSILNTEYTVCIMDNHMETFTLRMNQHIRLAERSYEIITADSE